MTSEEKLDLTRRTCRHLLYRIRDDKATRDLLGYGTQSFTLLVNTYAAIIGVEPVIIAAMALNCQASDINPNLLTP